MKKLLIIISELNNLGPLLTAFRRVIFNSGGNFSSNSGSNNATIGSITSKPTGSNRDYPYVFSPISIPKKPNIILIYNNTTRSFGVYIQFLDVIFYNKSETEITITNSTVTFMANNSSNDARTVYYAFFWYQ